MHRLATYAKINIYAAGVLCFVGVVGQTVGLVRSDMVMWALFFLIMVIGTSRWEVGRGTLNYIDAHDVLEKQGKLYDDLSNFTNSLIQARATEIAIVSSSFDNRNVN